MSRNIKIIPFSKPSIGRKELRAVRRVLKSGWLTTGPEALAFEKSFADFLADTTDSPGRPLKALSVNSATAGLHLALEAAGIQQGDLVAVPTMTFTATAEIVRYLGADPVFIDSDEKTGNMDPERLKEACRLVRNSGKSIRAVIPVHLAGRPCGIEDIRESIASTGVQGTVIIEDAAHAFPGRTASGMAGTLGDIGVFSFYATKTITTGEGGMIVTRNQDFAERIKLMRLHGIDRAVWNRYTADAGYRSWEYDVTAPGFKYNMPDISAALGREQLKRADSLLNKRRILAQRYSDGLRGIPDLRLPEDSDGHAWHLYIIHSRDSGQRDRLAGALEEEGIGSSVHFIPLHRMSYWKNKYNLKMQDFPSAERFHSGSLSLPLWPGLSWKKQKRIIRVIRKNLGGMV